MPTLFSHRPSTQHGNIAMFIFKKTIKFLRSEEAATAVEYAIMLAVIVLVMIQAIMALGTNTKTVYEDIANAFQ